MPVNLSIKNVPDDVDSRLRNRAVENQRSLQEELLIILKNAAEGHDPVSIDNLMEAQRNKPAFDEATSKVQAKKKVEQEQAARRFEDLLG